MGPLNLRFRISSSSSSSPLAFNLNIKSNLLRKILKRFSILLLSSAAGNAHRKREERVSRETFTLTRAAPFRLKHVNTDEPRPLNESNGRSRNGHGETGAVHCIFPCRCSPGYREYRKGEEAGRCRIEFRAYQSTEPH